MKRFTYTGQQGTLSQLKASLQSTLCYSHCSRLLANPAQHICIPISGPLASTGLGGGGHTFHCWEETWPMQGPPERCSRAWLAATLQSRVLRVSSLGGQSEVSGGAQVQPWSSGAGDKQEHLISSLYQKCLPKGRGVPTMHPKVTNLRVDVLSL